METRRKDLDELHLYIEEVDKELTMILQSLQWDRKNLLEAKEMVSCKYNEQHRIPRNKREEHESQCFLKCQGYTEEDKLLSDPVDANANTLVKLSEDDIRQIIENASSNDPTFKRGTGCQGSEPLTLDRLQASYTADERRAIHDAVVNAVPSCHDLSDLMLPSEEQKTKVKSRLEILAELRDMKRRRTKYRVAAKTRNYSDVLRDVIKTQMEVYTETQAEAPTIDNVNKSLERDHGNHKMESHNKHYHKERFIEDKRKKQINEDTKVKYKDASFKDKKRFSEEGDRRTKHRYKDEKSKDRNDKCRSKYDREYNSKSGSSKSSKHANASSSRDRGRYEERRYDNRDERYHKEESRAYSSSSKHKEKRYTSYYDNVDMGGDRGKSEEKMRRKY